MYQGYIQSIVVSECIKEPLFTGKLYSAHLKIGITADALWFMYLKLIEVSSSHSDCSGRSYKT